MDFSLPPKSVILDQPTRVQRCLELVLVFSFKQATFCGSSLGKRAGNHFTTADFESMGYHLCDTLLDYCDPDDSKVLVLAVY